MREGSKAGMGRGVSKSQSRGPRFQGSGGCDLLGGLRFLPLVVNPSGGAPHPRTASRKLARLPGCL